MNKDDKADLDTYNKMVLHIDLIEAKRELFAREFAEAAPFLQIPIIGYALYQFKKLLDL